MAKLIKFRGMSAAQLAEATREYDIPDPNPRPAPAPKELIAADRRVRAAARQIGRPRVGRGAKKIFFSIEQGLLEEADRARGRTMTRSQMIAIGLRLLMKLGLRPGMTPQQIKEMTMAELGSMLSKRGADAAKSQRRKRSA